jgi:hypothetical protein
MLAPGGRPLNATTLQCEQADLAWSLFDRVLLHASGLPQPPCSIAPFQGGLVASGGAEKLADERRLNGEHLK